MSGTAPSTLPAPVSSSGNPILVSTTKSDYIIAMILAAGLAAVFQTTLTAKFCGSLTLGLVAVVVVGVCSIKFDFRTKTYNFWALLALVATLPPYFLAPGYVSLLLYAGAVGYFLVIKSGGWRGNALSTALSAPLDFLRLLFAALNFGKTLYSTRAQAASPTPSSPPLLSNIAAPFLFVFPLAILILLANPFARLFATDFFTFQKEIFRDTPKLLFFMGFSIPIIFSAFSVRRALPLPTKQNAPQALSSNEGILRCIIGANLVLAVQTLSDIFVVGFGVALPDGATYSEYMYDAIWPLMAVAFITMLFVILAFPDRGEQHRNNLINACVYLWIGQVAFLIATCAARIWHYINAYGMTDLRLAGLFWIAIVFGGLVLLAIKFHADRSSSWLIDRCAALAFSVTLLCCYLPWTPMIAGWNVSRHIEDGQQIDFDYLVSQGDLAFSAIVRLAHESPSPDIRLKAAERFHVSNYYVNNLKSWTLYNAIFSDPD